MFCYGLRFNDTWFALTSSLWSSHFKINWGRSRGVCFYYWKIPGCDEDQLELYAHVGDSFHCSSVD